jgi:hypothetical protein
MVDEQIFSATVDSDKAKALIAVEPFDGSLCHALNFLMLADLEEHTAASLLDAGLTLVRTVGSGVALLAAPLGHRVEVDGLEHGGQRQAGSTSSSGQTRTLVTLRSAIQGIDPASGKLSPPSCQLGMVTGSPASIGASSSRCKRSPR